ncbi:hypothetical protein WUni_006390 [Wolbachia endosymbiont of Muscidifurax uniraptor]|nr:hypothetical protein WUni_006390 [Wolbachia endosymbiont of Muscidifurax uniraptor]
MSFLGEACKKEKILSYKLKMQYTRKLFRKSIVLSFTRTRKLPFSTVFSMILKLVKKSLGIECELM